MSKNFHLYPMFFSRLKTKALNFVAIFYEKIGNEHLSFKYYLLAAERSLTSAQFNVFASYDLEENYVDAFNWLKASAEQGYALSYFHLGYYYENGHGVKKDLNKALHWYTKSAELGGPNAQYALARIFSSESVGINDLSKAYQWICTSLTYPDVKNIHRSIFEEFQQLRIEIEERMAVSKVTFNW